jgi:Zn-finger protein
MITNCLHEKGSVFIEDGHGHSYWRCIDCHEVIEQMEDMQGG